MTVKLGKEWTIKQMHLWIAAVTVLIMIAGTLYPMAKDYVEGAESGTVTMESVRTNARTLQSHEERLKRLEQVRAEDRNLSLEIKINLKHLMHANGLHYEEITQRSGYD